MYDWTDALIEEIWARCMAASPEPWVAVEDAELGVVRSGAEDGPVVCGGELHEGYMAKDDPDGQFIAHARIDLPEAIIEIHRLNAAVKRLREEIAIRGRALDLMYCAALGPRDGKAREVIAGPLYWVERAEEELDKEAQAKLDGKQQKP